MSKYSRRKFLTASAGIAASGLAVGTLPNAMAMPLNKITSANDTVNIAVIGCNSIGWANLNAHLKVPNLRCIALCDVDDNVLKTKNADLEKRTGQKALEYKDYRKLLENKDLDAVIIGTPDHWHALQMIHACQAGKHVYVEKPMANSVEECLAMVKAAKQHPKIVVQVGQQQRSGAHWQSAIDYVKSGKLGKIRHVRTWIFNYNRPVPMPVPDSAPPAGVDYEMWLGPAPKRAFNQYRFHGMFRYFWDYAGGLMTDWGVHLIDIALAATGKASPQMVSSVGGGFAYPGSMMETPDTQQVLYHFGDMAISWEHTYRAQASAAPFGRQHGVAFYGENGCLVADRNNWEILPEIDDSSNPKKYKLEMLPRQMAPGDDRDVHSANFIDCIRTGKTPICDVNEGAKVAIVAQLGNISQRLGRSLTWNSANNNFGNDAEANKLLKANYREPWKLPS